MAGSRRDLVILPRIRAKFHNSTLTDPYHDVSGLGKVADFAPSIFETPALLQVSISATSLREGRSVLPADLLPRSPLPRPPRTLRHSRSSPWRPPPRRPPPRRSSTRRPPPRRPRHWRSSPRRPPPRPRRPPPRGSSARRPPPRKPRHWRSSPRTPPLRRPRHPLWRVPLTRTLVFVFTSPEKT